MVQIDIIVRISFTTLATIILVGPLFGVSIADFVYADGASCGSTALISLYTWLVVNGTMGLLSIVAFTMTYLGEKISLIDTANYHAALSIISIIIIIFNISWSVTGAISLFRDSLSCYSTAKSVWNVTLASLIISWYSTVALIIAMCVFWCCV
jgi:hypothetical protein